MEARLNVFTSPLAGKHLEDAEVETQLARRYFRWIGPATLPEFQWFSGLGVRAAKAAAEPLHLVPLPGTDRILDPFLECRRAAVLVLFYPCAENLCLVLTRRTDRLESHSGQISFPGGSMDAGEDAAATARRSRTTGLTPRSTAACCSISAGLPSRAGRSRRACPLPTWTGR